jgi:hypothetical protein
VGTASQSRVAGMPELMEVVLCCAVLQLSAADAALVGSTQGSAIWVDRIVLCFSSAACTLHACSLYCLSCACMQVLAVVGSLLKSCTAVACLQGAILGLC